MKVLIVYNGKLNKFIGPPSTMNNLYNLLSKHFHCDFLHRSGSSVLSSNSNLATTHRRKAILQQFVLLLYAIFYSIRISIYLLRNKDARVIVCQRYYLIPQALVKNVIFFNLVSEDEVDYEMVRPLRLMANRFQSSIKLTRVCLAKFNSKYKYQTVLDLFNFNDYNLTSELDEIARIFTVGSFTRRKGADRIRGVLEVSQNLKYDISVTVYGTYNKYERSHDRLKLMGPITDPFQLVSTGDIFLSFSEKEGFQRALVEALLRGCLVIASKRDDTLTFEHCPGVKIIDFDKAEPEGINSAAEIINSFKELSISQRLKFGRANSEYVKKLFDEEVILNTWKKLVFHQ